MRQLEEDFYFDISASPRSADSSSFFPLSLTLSGSQHVSKTTLDSYPIAENQISADNMGVGSRICPELSLDCPSSSKYFIQKPIWKFFEEVSSICIVSEKISKLDEYVTRLHDEMKKIYGFKRELPLCLLLLNDAIVMMKDELMKCRRSSTQPLMTKEFIPLKKDEIESIKENAFYKYRG